MNPGINELKIKQGAVGGKNAKLSDKLHQEMKVLWKQRQTVRQVSLSCYCRGGPRSDRDAAKSVSVVQIWWGVGGGVEAGQLILYDIGETRYGRDLARGTRMKEAKKGNICSIWFRLWTGPVTGNNPSLRVNGLKEIDSHMSAHRSSCFRKPSKTKRNAGRRRFSICSWLV